MCFRALDVFFPCFLYEGLHVVLTCLFFTCFDMFLVSFVFRVSMCLVSVFFFSGSPRAWSGVFLFFTFQGLACLKQLKCLRLAWNKGVTDEVVEKVCGSMKGLKELDLSLCGKITCRSLQVGHGMVTYTRYLVSCGLMWYEMYGVVWYDRIW